MVGRLFSASKESGVSSKMAIPEDNGFKIISCGLNEHISKGEQLFITYVKNTRDFSHGMN